MLEDNLDLNDFFKKVAVYLVTSKLEVLVNSIIIIP